MSSKMSMSFFLQSKRIFFRIFLDIMDSMGSKRFKVQMRVPVQTANCSKGFKRFQTMNKGLIKRNDHSFNK